MRSLFLALAALIATPLHAQTVTVPPTVSIDEGKAWSVPVKRVGPKTATLSFTFRTITGEAVAGVDFVARSGSQSIRKNALTYTINGQSIDDAAFELDEDFTVEVTAKGQLPVRTTIVIRDNDPAPPPPPVICPDGSQVTPPVTCPVPPPPTSGDELSPSLAGAPPIASEFDPMTYLAPSWGSGAIAPSAAPDVVGAFRFILADAGLSYDDCIVFPGQPGKSHLHQYYGSMCPPDGTYASLRAGAGKNTQSPLNRSAYWMPAMLDGKGNVIRPDTARIYYKRRPATDPAVSDPTNPKYEGQAVELPNGLKFIFGYDMLTGKAPTGGLYFNCDGNGSIQGHYPSIEAALASGNCKAGTNPANPNDRGSIGAILNAPSCWDGKRLDSANHRDHVAYKDYGYWGYPKCPPTHPYVIPDFTLQAWFTIAPGDDLSQWRLSSDEMHPELPHGSTFHADILVAWDPTVKKMWHDWCINKLENCSGGDVGNGKQIKGFSQPPGYGWGINPNRVTPVSSIPH